MSVLLLLLPCRSQESNSGLHYLYLPNHLASPRSVLFKIRCAQRDPDELIRALWRDGRSADALCPIPVILEQRKRLECECPREQSGQDGRRYWTSVKKWDRRKTGTLRGEFEASCGHWGLSPWGTLWEKQCKSQLIIVPLRTDSRGIYSLNFIPWGGEAIWGHLLSGIFSLLYLPLGTEDALGQRNAGNLDYEGKWSLGKFQMVSATPQKTRRNAKPLTSVLICWSKPSLKPKSRILIYLPLHILRIFKK